MCCLTCHKRILQVAQGPCPMRRQGKLALFCRKTRPAMRKEKFSLFFFVFPFIGSQMHYTAERLLHCSSKLLPAYIVTLTRSCYLSWQSIIDMLVSETLTVCGPAALGFFRSFLHYLKKDKYRIKQALKRLLKNTLKIWIGKILWATKREKAMKRLAEQARWSEKAF